MRLIIGEMFQGKKEYALLTYGDNSKLYMGLAKLVGEEVAGFRSEMKASEELCFVDSCIEKIYDKVLSEIDKDAIVIADGGYCGLTPIDRKERDFYEVYGRILSLLARDAQSVERVVCGLAITLK